MLISIIVPCYNQGEFLNESLASVFDQIYQNWECVIVNDGSNDETEAVARLWCTKDSRFKYIKQSNKGLSAARNLGICEALGNYILPLDADDQIGTSYIHEAMKALKNNENIKLVYCNALRFGIENGPWELQSYSYENLLIENMIFCSAIFKKEDAIRVGGYDEDLKTGLEDWDFWIRLLDPRSVVLKLDIVGFRYRIKEKSMAKDLNKSIEKFNEIKEIIFLKNLKIYRKHFGELFDFLKVYKQLKKFEQKTKETLIYKIFNYFRN